MASSKQASIQTFANVYVYSELTDQQLKDSMLNPTSNIEQTLHELEEQYGRKIINWCHATRTTNHSIC